MPLRFKLSDYKNNIFIETGTYQGDGVKQALWSGFNNIYSIEIDESRFNKCREMFKDCENVTIIHGDSGIELSTLLEKINEPVTFWIDAHYCADGAHIGDKWSPIKDELNAIKLHHIKTHTILIDDWRCMDNTHIDYTWNEQTNLGSKVSVDDKNGKEVGFLGKDICLEFIKSINHNYKLSFVNGVEENDVLCCVV